MPALYWFVTDQDHRMNPPLEWRTDSEPCVKRLMWAGWGSHLRALGQGKDHESLGKAMAHERLGMESLSGYARQEWV